VLATGERNPTSLDPAHPDFVHAISFLQELPLLADKSDNGQRGCRDTTSELEISSNVPPPHQRDFFRQASFLDRKWKSACVLLFLMVS
jgi:hypothetical protein